MATTNFRIKLFFLRRAPQTLGSEVVCCERIRALLDIGDSQEHSKRVRQDCIVDTGAFLSIFPQKQWERFEGDVTWLYTPGDEGEYPDWLIKVTGLGAESVDCRIGKIKLRIFDRSFAIRTPPVEVLAKFPEDGGRYKQILLGLGGGALSEWQLVVDEGNADAWLDGVQRLNDVAATSPPPVPTSSD